MLSNSFSCYRHFSSVYRTLLVYFCILLVHSVCAFVCRLNRGGFFKLHVHVGLSEGLVQRRLLLNTEWALKTPFIIRSGLEGHVANSLYILARFEKLPTVCPGRVEFRAGQVTFKAPHLPSGQESRQVIFPQLKQKLTKTIKTNRAT